MQRIESPHYFSPISEHRHSRLFRVAAERAGRRNRLPHLVTKPLRQQGGAGGFACLLARTKSESPVRLSTLAASTKPVRTVYPKGSGTRPKCAGARGTTILRTSASRTVTGTSQRTGTTTSGFVVPGMRSAASVALRLAGGSWFPPRRFRERQLRFRAGR